jgi:hypothetical protein
MWISCEELCKFLADCRSRSSIQFGGFAFNSAAIRHQPTLVGGLSEMGPATNRSEFRHQPDEGFAKKEGGPPTPKRPAILLS